MSKILTPSYSDDLSHVEGISFKLDPSDEKGETILSSGASLSASQRVSVVLTQGEKVYILDTAQGNAVAALIRSQGVKQSKRGRKPSA